MAVPTEVPSFQADLSYRSIWRLAWPIIAGGIGTNIINVTDTAFLGRVSEVALGAAALGSILYYLLVIVAIASATGLQIIIARRMGEQKPQQVGPALDNAIAVNLLLAVGATALLYALAQPLLALVVASPAVREATLTYVYARGWGLPFIFLFWTWRGFYGGIGKPAILMWATLAMAAVNVVLDYALIFGAWGLPRWGVFGAGVASAIAEGVEALVPLVYFLYRKYPAQFQALRFQKLSRELTLRLAKLSGPMVFQNLLTMGAWFAFFLVIEKMGERQLAASNLARSLYMVGMIPGWGFAVAANTVVSNVIGQGKTEWVWDATLRTLTLTTTWMVFFGVVACVFPRTLLRIYTQDPALIETAVPLLYVIAGALVCFAFGIIPLNAVMGTGATKVSFALEVINITVYLGLVLLISQVWQGTMLQVWLAEPVYFFTMGSMGLWYLRSGGWRRLAGAV